MADAIYFFIDGGYVRTKYADAINRVFGVDGAEPDFATVQLWCYGKRFGSSISATAVPQRFFYYDCLHDIKKANETDQRFKTRVEQQNGFFKRIQSLDGFHVRLGSLAGTGKKVRQKKVDVLLAVEMLDNSFRKNMAAAVLLAGDSDFIPVTEAVMRHGTWVEVCYDPTGASEELYSTADKAVPLTFNDLWSWGTDEFRTKYPLPTCQLRGDVMIPLFRPKNMKTGKNPEGRIITLAERGDKPGEFFLYVDVPENSIFLTHTDPNVIEAYYAEQFGNIIWDKGQRLFTASAPK